MLVVGIKAQDQDEDKDEDKDESQVECPKKNVITVDAFGKMLVRHAEWVASGDREGGGRGKGEGGGGGKGGEDKEPSAGMRWDRASGRMRLGS